MDQKKVLTILLSFWSIILFAQPQQVISSSGGVFENSSGSISFTIGECVISSLSSAGTMLTQGFQQPKLAIIENSPVSLQGMDIVAFPNPAEEFVILKTEDFQGLSYTLYDLHGRIVQQNDIISTETQLNFNLLEPSTYLLKVTRNKTVLRTFKINKYSFYKKFCL